MYFAGVFSRIHIEYHCVRDGRPETGSETQTNAYRNRALLAMVTQLNTTQLNSTRQRFQKVYVYMCVRNARRRNRPDCDCDSEGVKSENRGIETSRHPGPGRATSRAGTISSKETGNGEKWASRQAEWSGVETGKHDR